MTNAGGTEESKKPLIAKPRVFIDADVLIAGSVSTEGASHIILHLSDLTIIEGFISQQVRIEVERNLQEKLPQALPVFRRLIDSAVEVVADPTVDEIAPFEDQADSDDLPILTAAIKSGCHYLLTFNVRHYCPVGGRITVLRPGEFLVKLRRQIVGLIPENPGGAD
jgi:predicted nucleic acid-binding protein